MVNNTSSSIEGATNSPLQNPSMRSSASNLKNKIAEIRCVPLGKAKKEIISVLKELKNVNCGAIIKSQRQESEIIDLKVIKNDKTDSLQKKKESKLTKFKSEIAEAGNCLQNNLKRLSHHTFVSDNQAMAVSTKSAISHSSVIAEDQAITHTQPPATFDLEAAKKQIGVYDVKSKSDNLSDAGKEKLFNGCPRENVTTKREAFLELLHAHLANIPPGKNREITTLSDLLGGNKELLKAYKEAVKEEANSTSFREAVFSDCTKELKTNPCPGKKMIMYIGGPSASGKSFTQNGFVDEVSKNLNKDGKTDTCYTVSIDGGKERELCQMRQMILQAATKNGYGGISDLHKNTHTKVKNNIMKAAMRENEKFHVVIPATFIAEMHQLVKLMKKVADDPNVFQVFAEVRADKTGNVPKNVAMESFKQTIIYNGESRSYLQASDDKPNIDAVEMKMNNTSIGCESKVYEQQFFQLGVMFSSIAKKMFKAIKNDENSMILSNECDNLHVKKVGDRWVQTTENPTVKHVSAREVNLWEKVSSENVSETDLKEAFGKLNNTERSPEEFEKQFAEFKEKLDEARSQAKKNNKDYDLGDFLKLLQANNMRSNMKITKS